MKRPRSLSPLIPCLILAGGLLAAAPRALASDWAPGQMVVSLYPGYSIDDVNARYQTYTLGAYPEADLYLITVPSGQTEAGFESTLVGDADVEVAERNWYTETPEGIRQMVISATGGTYTEFADQGAAVRVGTDPAHSVCTGSGVTVAVLDSGIDPSHAAFAGRISPEAYDFLTYDYDPSETADGIDNDGDGEIDEGYGHGTMVAGIVSLVAPDATILPIRVLDDEGHGESYKIAKAIRYAGFHGARVINMSFGIPRHISMIAHEIDAVDDLGITVVAGAGNEDQESPTYFPADHSKAIMVTALDSVDVKADFADYNSKVLVSAPGAGIRSAFPGGGWAIGSGCSFATPFVSGEAALVACLQPSATPREIEQRMEAAVDDIYQLAGNAPYDGKLGTGRIDLPLAVAAASTGVGSGRGPAPRVLAAPNPASGPVTLSAPPGAGPDARLSATVFDAAGRRVAAVSGVGDGVVWDGRDGFGRRVPAGVYLARITAGARSASTRFVVVR